MSSRSLCWSAAAWTTSSRRTTRSVTNQAARPRASKPASSVARKPRRETRAATPASNAAAVPYDSAAAGLWRARASVRLPPSGSAYPRSVPCSGVSTQPSPAAARPVQPEERSDGRDEDEHLGDHDPHVGQAEELVERPVPRAPEEREGG